MPLLFPLIIGGTGLLSGVALGGAGGYSVAQGAEKVGDALKWAVIGIIGIAAIGGVVYIAKR